MPAPTLRPSVVTSSTLARVLTPKDHGREIEDTMSSSNYMKFSNNTIQVFLSQLSLQRNLLETRMSNSSVREDST